MAYLCKRSIIHDTKLRRISDASQFIDMYIYYGYGASPGEPFETSRQFSKTSGPVGFTRSAEEQACRSSGRLSARSSRISSGYLPRRGLPYVEMTSKMDLAPPRYNTTVSRPPPWPMMP